ncbi:hypothetical protein BH10ACI3_BH10ACI3_26200 [soil metagenome]
MFDKLIESEPAGADFKNRRTYFMVSSAVVGVLFATAVVISIFAADIGLGSNSFELVEMIAPVMSTTEPETPRPRPPASAVRSQSPLPTRQVNMLRVDEVPRVVPTTVSVVPNTQQARPDGYYRITGQDTDPNVPSGSGRDQTGPGSGDGIQPASTVSVVKDPEPEPPTVKKDPEVKKVVTQSLGVINGKASYLPKPAYSAAAKAVHAAGSVNVQVTIDENGKVVSANAVSGHPLLRDAAVAAARSAKFTTTYLSNVPVKVTGVIVYNFVI